MATIKQARALGTYEVFNGDYRTCCSMRRPPYEAVTAADVQALARRILRVQNRTTGLAEPVAATAQAKEGAR